MLAFDHVGDSYEGHDTTNDRSKRSVFRSGGCPWRTLRVSADRVSDRQSPGSQRRP